MADNFTYEILDELNQYEAGEVYFGDWEIVKELGGGSYGTVYQMEKTDYGITLQSAMKVIRIPADPSEIKAMRSAGATLADISAMNEEQAADAAREVRSMVSLQKHLNVVRCEDFRVFKYRSEERWDILIRMEMLCALPDYFERENIAPGPETAVELGLAISRALTACEARKLLHRDIKPSNIFVEIDEFDGTVTYKLGDFGSSRASRGGSTAMTRRGTDFYMAPEVMTEDHYDARADIYSLGLVMYQLSNNNRLPFFPQPGQPMTFAAQNKALMRRLSNTPLPAPANADETLSAIILKMCAYKPEDRYPSAKELLLALKEYSGNNIRKIDAALEQRYLSEIEQQKQRLKDAQETIASLEEQLRKKTSELEKSRKSAVSVVRETQEGWNRIIQARDSEIAALKKQLEVQKVKQTEQPKPSADSQYEYNRGMAFHERADYISAAACFRNAAEQGCAAAQYELGRYYSVGHGVNKDFKEAVHWYREAAEQGLAAAQHAIGYCYYCGHGVTKDYREAARWYRKAADQNYAAAQCFLGYCYCYGYGVSKNIVQAQFWLNKAKKNGDQEAADFLKEHLKSGRFV